MPGASGVRRPEDAGVLLHRRVHVSGRENEANGGRLGQDGHHAVHRVQLLELLRQVQRAVVPPLKHNKNPDAESRNATTGGAISATDEMPVSHQPSQVLLRHPPPQ